MIQKYVQKSMDLAHYELLPENPSFYGEVPPCPGVYANAPTLEDCRRELEETLEAWILIRVNRDLPIPPIDDVEIRIKSESSV